MIIKDVLGMMVFFVTFVALWLWLVYRFVVLKITKERFRIWIEGGLIIAIIVCASLVLYFFNGLISVFLKTFFNL
jgi:hypothetical protein